MYYRKFGFISPYTINIWMGETDAEASPKKNNLRKIACILNCSEDDLLEDIVIDDITNVEHELLLYCKNHKDYIDIIKKKLDDLK